MNGGPRPDGGRGNIKVTPQDVATGAKTFSTAQNDLSNAWSTLQSALDYNAGMAGDDQPANSFNATYAPAAKAAWKALRSSALTVGGISLGLTQTANNFVTAEHHSTATAKGAPSTFAPEPVFVDILMPDPASATGPGETVWFLPGPLSKFWPNAHTDKLRAAATAWHNTAQAVATVTGTARGAIVSLESSDDTTHAINGFWSKVYTSGDNNTVLAGTYQICQSLGDACGKYADAIDNKRSDIKDKMIGAGFAVGVTSIIGILGTVFTGGGSDAAAGALDVAEVSAIVGDVAAETAATVEADVAVTLGTDLVTTVEAAAEDVPAVVTAEAETTAVQSDIEGSLNREMVDEEGPPGAKQGCFVAGTTVLTKAGSRPIEFLSFGDFVLATDPTSGVQRLCKVNATMVHEVSCLVDITIAGQRIECSPEHPFWLSRKGWTKAGELQVDDVVIDAQLEEHKIEAAATKSGTFIVYNIEVDGLHTYHVSPCAILVHNKPWRAPEPEGEPKRVDDNWLKRKGVDPHEVKSGGYGSGYDVYVDRNDNMFVVRKGQNPRNGEYIGNLDNF
jgi:pretoxin HINT domain-containing protein